MEQMKRGEMFTANKQVSENERKRRSRLMMREEDTMDLIKVGVDSLPECYQVNDI